MLPALPADWDNGSVSGLRARGEYDVSIRWKNGRMQTVDIHGIKGGAIKVRYGEKTMTVTVNTGATLHLNSEIVAVN